MDFFKALLGGDTPEFVRCACGTMSTIAPCWECAKASEVQHVEAQADADRGIPARFRWARLDSPDLEARVHVAERRGRIPTAQQAAAAMLSHPGPAVTLVGPAGSGKTSLAVAAMRGVPRALYVAAASLERARIEHRAGDGESPLVARAMRAPLLVIDDVGQDKPSSVSALEAVILARHDAELRTWVTTGLGGSVATVQAALDARYNAGVARRLCESGTALVIGFTGGKP
jgi:DNA replication protein DnaC